MVFNMVFTMVFNMYIYVFLNMFSYFYFIYIYISSGFAHAAGPPKAALPRPVSSIQVTHFNFLKAALPRPVSSIQVTHSSFLKAHPLQEPPLRRDSLLSWTSHKIQSRSEMGANNLVFGSRGEPHRRGEQQLSTSGLELSP